MPKQGRYKSVYGMVDMKNRRACQLCGESTINRFYCHDCWKHPPNFDMPVFSHKEIQQVSALVVDSAKFNPSVPRGRKKKIKLETDLDFTTKQDMLSPESDDLWELPANE